ncbi:MAG: uroporphyrinogen-III synthase [Alphaproteobacteria bacterium]|nr:uroporphyrinogen-III synthase [Alphaproteobacteria bacterium]
MPETVLITRPIDNAMPLAKVLEEMGCHVLIEPMLTIEPIAFDRIDFSKFDGFIFTSKNAIKSLPNDFSAHEKPIYTVGQSTAEEALQTGFQNVQCTGKDVEELISSLTEKAGSYAYFQGENVTVSISERLMKIPGISIQNIVSYRAVPAPNFSDNILKIIINSGIEYVLFYSRRTADNFVHLMHKNDCTRAAESIQVLCLADSMLESLSVLPWKQIHVSDYPDQKHMLALLKEVQG